MGKAVDRIVFSPEDFRSFRDALESDLITLRDLLDRPGFGEGPSSVGAELEIYLVDAAGRPLHCNTELISELGDRHMTPELNRFNLEFNLDPERVDQHPFRSTEEQMRAGLQRIDRQLLGRRGRSACIGILPTLELADFDHRTMTDMPRFHALRQRLQDERRDLFRIHIEGEDPLSLATDDITLEGANTSFQLHYRVSPDRFADTFNAIQLVTPLVLALAANSPLVFGRRLWHESRIPLFKQSIDSRPELRVDAPQTQQPARVNFGHGWVRRDAWELFAEAARLYPPLLPLLRSSPESRSAETVPTLDELRLQMGTIWLWNRPVYDDADGGHLRIEMRSLPSGPTPVDMVANGALLIGLAEGLRPHINELMTALPFRDATRNLYRAARNGMEAELAWPSTEQCGLHSEPVRTLARRLLPVAAQGLESIGVKRDEAQQYLRVIDDRLRTGRNGAIWQREAYSRLRQRLDRGGALHALLEQYIGQSAENRPVSEWTLPE